MKNRVDFSRPFPDDDYAPNWGYVAKCIFVRKVKVEKREKESELIAFRFGFRFADKVGLRVGTLWLKKTSNRKGKLFKFLADWLGFEPSGKLTPEKQLGKEALISIQDGEIVKIEPVPVPYIGMSCCHPRPPRKHICRINANAALEGELDY